MNKTVLKRILKITGATVAILTVVLCVHIYLVTRPKAPDAHTIVMARIDVKKPISNDEAAEITRWFYQQPGVDHVVCSAEMGNVVFTYYPVKGNANEIASLFKTQMGFADAVRYMPGEKDIKGGCPVASTSYTYKIYNFFKHSL